MRDPHNPADLAAGQHIVQRMLQQFDLQMQRLESDPSLNLVYVRTQGTLLPVQDRWANEPHPNPDGFIAIAGKFAAAIRARFPVV